MGVRDVEYISREVSLGGACPSCGSCEWYPALIREEEGEFQLGAHCDECLAAEGL